MIEEKSLRDKIIREDELEQWLNGPRATTLRYDGLPYVQIGAGRSTGVITSGMTL